MGLVEGLFLLMTRIGTDIHFAAKLLEQGEVVAIPTETVYGLAANALNPAAVLKIFKAKNRPQFNPLIIHLSDWKEVEKYASPVPDAAHLLASSFSPGPITFLLSKKPLIPDLVTAGSPKVAIRIPSHPVAHELLERTGFPLAAPSANPFGYVSPTTAQHVWEGLSGRIPYILDGGPCKIGLESTIVDFEDSRVIVLRKGGVSVEDIESVTGPVVTVRTDPQEHPVAPGQLKSHYATLTPLFWGDPDDLVPKFYGQKICLLDFGAGFEDSGFYRYFNLSEKGSLDEAATNLFRIMREADQCGADVILVKKLPESGLGRAINDRLKRACHNMKSA